MTDVGIEVRRKSSFAAGILVLLLMCAGMSPAHSVSSTLTNPIQEKLTAEAQKLAATSNSATSAEDSLDAVRSRLLEAQELESTAIALQEEAVERQKLIEHRVAKKMKDVARSKKELEISRQKIWSLARQNYISGGDGQELEILLSANDTNDFAVATETLLRTSRENNDLFEIAGTNLQKVSKELVELEALKKEADATAVEAGKQLAEARKQRQIRQEAQNQIEALTQTRQQQLAANTQSAAELREIYNKLVSIKGAKYVKGSVGVGRSPKEAIQWALQHLGAGTEYNGQCLRFVDQAYAVTGRKQNRAIDQWTAALAAGKGHPGDTNPPIGAHLFWLSSNPARHIAIYAGQGMVISTGVNGGRVGLVPWDYFAGYGPYLGWATPYYGG